MSARFTPGPWEARPYYYQDGDGADKRLIDTAFMDTIAEVRMGHDDIAGDIDANARLIAAAPDMFEALNDLLTRPTDPAARIRARAALAKAIGQPETPSSSSLHTPVEDRGRDGLVSVKSEHRLSGERPRHARADHAAGSRSSDGSDAISATDASPASSSSPAGAVRGAASANRDDVA